MSGDVSTWVGVAFGVIMLASAAGTAVANFRSNRNREALTQQQATIAALEQRVEVMKDSNTELAAQLGAARAEAGELRGQMQVLQGDFAKVIAEKVVDIIPTLWGHGT